MASHHFASERSRNFVSWAHGYSSNILSAWRIQAYACKHATLSFISRLSCTTHYQMEMERFELLTPCLQGRCSPNWATPPLGKSFYLIYQLVYFYFKPVGLSGPFLPSSDYPQKRLNSFKPMGLSGLEPPTSRLSGVRSNQLSYKPSYG